MNKKLEKLYKEKTRINKEIQALIRADSEAKIKEELDEAKLKDKELNPLKKKYQELCSIANNYSFNHSFKLSLEIDCNISVDITDRVLYEHNDNFFSIDTDNYKVEMKLLKGDLNNKQYFTLKDVVTSVANDACAEVLDLIPEYDEEMQQTLKQGKALYKKTIQKGFDPDEVKTDMDVYQDLVKARHPLAMLGDDK